MISLKSTLVKGALVAAVASSALVATTASAAVACNRMGECWRVTGRYAYPPGLGVTFHRDSWWGRHPGFHWRGDRFGRGYYRNGVWIRF